MDRQHVEQLFRQHYRRMYSVACSLLYDGQESEDVVSEVFAHLLESDTELLPTSAEGYLIVAVRNRCLKRLRDNLRRTPPDSEYPGIPRRQISEDYEVSCRSESRVQSSIRYVPDARFLR